MFPYGMDRVGSVPSCNSLPWVVMVSFGIHSDQNLLSTTWWWTVYTLYIYENIGKYVFSAYTYVCISGISITSTTSFIYMYIYIIYIYMYTKLHLACLEPNPSLLWVYNGVLISCLEVNKFPNPPCYETPPFKQRQSPGNVEIPCINGFVWETFKDEPENGMSDWSFYRPETSAPLRCPFRNPAPWLFCFRRVDVGWNIRGVKSSTNINGSFFNQQHWLMGNFNQCHGNI
jgi:hypothetical protein